MRSPTGLAVIATTVVALAVWGGVALASRSTSTAPLATGRINVTATLTHNVGRRVGPRGKQSDVIEQAWRITDQNGRAIGRVLMRCSWVVRRARLCSGEMQMPLGKISFLGSSPTPFEGEYAVTGGTGVYRGGGGVMLFTAIGLRKNVLLVTITT